MKHRKLVYDSEMVITLSYQMGNVIEVAIWMGQIMKQLMTKFGSLKVDNGGDKVMYADDDA